MTVIPDTITAEWHRRTWYGRLWFPAWLAARVVAGLAMLVMLSPLFAIVALTYLSRGLDRLTGRATRWLSRRTPEVYHQ